MRFVAEAGTDVAQLALFDPEALPEDYDTRSGRDRTEELEALEAEGRLFYTATGSDGAYLLHLYLDEPIPETLAGFCEDPVVCPAFLVPSGVLWFCGAEYVFHRNDAELRKYPHCGTRMDLPAGVYEARLFRTEYPEEYVESEVEAVMGPEAFQRREAIGCQTCLGNLLTLVAAVALFLSWFSAWSLLLAGVVVVFWAVLRARLRSPIYRRQEEQAREVYRQHPSIVAEFRTLPGRVEQVPDAVSADVRAFESVKGALFHQAEWSGAGSARLVRCA